MYDACVSSREKNSNEEDEDRERFHNDKLEE